jgi:hypothetical protein
VEGGTNQAAPLPLPANRNTRCLTKQKSGTARSNMWDIARALVLLDPRLDTHAHARTHTHVHTRTHTTRSNMWDIARALVLLDAGLDTAFNQTLLPAAFVDSWMANVTRYVGYVQSLFPNSVIGWHTISIGEVQKDGSMRHFTLGKKSFMVQLNAAGRAVAQQLGLLLMDYEAITAGFHDNRYLMDQHHPTDKVRCSRDACMCLRCQRMLGTAMFGDVHHERTRTLNARTAPSTHARADPNGGCQPLPQPTPSTAAGTDGTTGGVRPHARHRCAGERRHGSAALGLTACPLPSRS